MHAIDRPDVPSRGPAELQGELVKFESIIKQHICAF